MKKDVSGDRMPLDTSTDNLKSAPKAWASRVRDYFAGDLGGVYSLAVNRLTLYPFIFTCFLVECTTFWILYLGKSFFFNYMSFVMIYSLHKAAVYSLCIFAADTAAHYLLPAWGAYKKRSVRKQWLIWTIGLLVGFVLQRTMVFGLIIHYAPEVIGYFTEHPKTRLSNFELLLYLTPYWCLVMYIAMRIALSKQRIIDQARSLMVLPDGQKKGSPEPLRVNQPEEGKKGLLAGSLSWENENGNVSVPLADITHITVEDHYCRVNYSTGEGLKSKMIRLPLKEMLPKLPQDHFIKIHRSHVVNSAHVSRLKRKGRDHKVVMRNVEVELPLSRSRFKNLAPRFSRQ